LHKLRYGQRGPAHALGRDLCNGLKVKLTRKLAAWVTNQAAGSKTPAQRVQKNVTPLPLRERGRRRGEWAPADRTAQAADTPQATQPSTAPAVQRNSPTAQRRTPPDPPAHTHRPAAARRARSEEHTSELQSREN